METDSPHTATPARDFMVPALNALLARAADSGIERDVALAVLIDLVTSGDYNTTPIDPTADDPAEHEGSSDFTTHEVAVAEGMTVPARADLGAMALGYHGRIGSPGGTLPE